jgi:hypothetical protein
MLDGAVAWLLAQRLPGAGAAFPSYVGAGIDPRPTRLAWCYGDLGLAGPQVQSPIAVRRAAPMAFLVYALVLLWYADAHACAASTAWVDRPWYPAKTSPSFLDMLTALRRAGWRRYLFESPVPSRRRRNPAFSWPEAVLATA